MPGRDFMDRHRTIRILVDLLIIIASFYIIEVVWNVLTNFGDILLLFFLAWVITFILEPVSSFLVGKRVFGRPIPRVIAVSLVYLALLVVISGMIVLAVPAVQAQVTQVAQLIQTDLSASHLRQISAGLSAMLQRLGFSQPDANNLVNQIIAQVPARTREVTSQAVNSASSLLGTVATGVFDGSIVVILSFYMMLDGGRLTEGLVLKLPPSWEPDLRLFQTYINDMFAGFFRAQLIVAGLYAAATWAILLAMGDGNGAFLAAFLAGIFMLLPFVGAFLAIVPPALLVLLQTSPDQLVFKLILLVFLLGAAQHVVLNLLAPRIYGQHLGIDPILLFGALLLGARVGGVWGAFFAAPIVAILYAIFETFYDRFASTHPMFQPEESEADAIEGIAPPALDDSPLPHLPQQGEPGANPHKSVPGMSGIYRISGLTTRNTNGVGRTTRTARDPRGASAAGRTAPTGEKPVIRAQSESDGTGSVGDGNEAGSTSGIRITPPSASTPGASAPGASTPGGASNASGTRSASLGRVRHGTRQTRYGPPPTTPEADGARDGADRASGAGTHAGDGAHPDGAHPDEDTDARENSGILPFPWRHPHTP